MSTDQQPQFVPSPVLDALDKALADYTIMREELRVACNMDRRVCRCRPGFRCIVCNLIEGPDHGTVARQLVGEMRERAEASGKAKRELRALAPEMAEAILAIIDEDGFVSDLSAFHQQDKYQLLADAAEKLRAIGGPS